MSKRSTIRDVAERAGVAVSTVSYVINDRGSVAPSTRLRVQAAIRELRFEPNQAARNLKHPAAASIGLIVPDLRNAFFALVAEGAQDVAYERDVLVVLCATDAQAERESYYARMLRSQRLTGVIYLSGSGMSTRSIIELATLEPIVFVDERLAGLDVPWVGSDNRAGATTVARHVLDHGHRRLAIVSGPELLWSSEQRMAGYREALAGAGIDPDGVPVHRGDYRQQTGATAAATLLAGPRETWPTAILCANDLMAFGVVEHCRAHGIRIPEDLSLVGFDDLPMASLLLPPLTTVEQQAHEMGRRAMTLLLDHDEPAEGRRAAATLPTRLIERGSVAAPVH